MKKNLFVLISQLITIGWCFANESDNLQNSLKTNQYEPNYLSIIIALIFVIALIYVTGILYTKLNKISLKTVKKEFSNESGVKPVILSTTPVGTDKTIQVVEIAGEKLLIGVTAHSINLIKTINDIPETNTTTSANNDIKENTAEDTSINDEQFGLYKKYLR